MKKFVALLLALLMALSCTAFAEEEVTYTAKEGEKVLEFWCGIWEQYNQNWIQSMVNKWNANEDRPFFVNLTWGVEEQKLAAARAAEIAPDVFTASYGAIASDFQNGYIMDLKPLIAEESWNDLLDSAKEFVTVGDAYVAYPWMMEPAIVMYYDKDAFTEAGLDPESPPTTWDELIEYAEALTTEDRMGMDIDASYNMWGWYYTANGGQHIITDDWSKSNLTDGLKEFAEFYKTIRNSTYCSQTALKAQNSGAYSVLEGRSAISFSGSWGVGGIDRDYPEKRDSIGVAAAPTADGSPMHSTSGGWTLAIDAKSKQAEMGAEFITYMLGNVAAPEDVADFFVAASFSKFTCRQSVADYLVANTAAATDERMQTIQSDIMPYVIAEPIYGWELHQNVLNTMADIAINGTDIDEAFAALEELNNQYLIDNQMAGKNPKAQ